MRRGGAGLSGRLLGVGATIALWAGTAGLTAQEPTLDAVDSLTARGDVERAREVLTSWWEGAWAEAARLERQRALWLRGRLTVDPAMARRDYTRLAVEFPGGRYSDQALYRLGLEAAASGNLLEAAARFEELASGYPSSPLRLDARGWLSAHREEISDARRQAASEPAEPPDEAALEGRETPVAEAPAARGGKTRVETGRVRGRMTVQLGAFSTEERARRFAREVEAAGYDVRLVRLAGSELIRVRAGRFEDESEARALGSRL
ncbi:MAG: hypothetical protein GWM92_19140, partial [Gemmatimonadetes bacterium]|nr:hypothetical protein [Gemmatimonadota bacterium]NIR80921.1 hypothetical protein [Gemmatimonadota bacterium]NIT89739.1 hypothetical protein [Gemmatimonadota bacterium]NIU33525.1 hypothetical protein [Gemmatimonadota bacterium]NIU37795.1 hypothetical protein [Gemmatimonadota bacterium]